MSSVEAGIKGAESSPVVRQLGQLEQRLERWSERLNPILVKEARQALKSRQFTITFSLVLICAWAWSVLGIFTQLPDIYYAPSGVNLLIGYYLILAVPLLLIVPFSAFRSLAVEREDATYELLWISALSSRQIVTGKLGSAILQMIVYYSALAPCIAFTYMLRGVDIVTVLLLLTYTFCLSVLLCCLGLLFAGLSRSRQWQSLMSVLLLLGLIFVGFFWLTMILSLAFNGVSRLPLDEAGFWTAQAAVLTALVTYVILLILAATAQNSFASDNRSTRIRIAMFVQAALFVGWVTYGWIQVGDDDLLISATIFAMIHWYAYGVLLTGETATLSPRVRRHLPMSFFGRVFLTWFNPGSGTGFVFAVSHVLLLMGLVAVAIVVQRDFGLPTGRFASGHDKVLLFVSLLAGYYVAYLGLSRLVVRLIPRRERFGLLLPSLLNVLILLLGCAAPFLYESWAHRYGTVRYSFVQSSNWLWTLGETMGGGIQDPFVVTLVFLAAVVVLVVNLINVRAEIESVRTETPERVRLDDASQTGQDRSK